jgi:hypothetical protein
LLRYRDEHPEFAHRHPRVFEEVEKELKPGLVAGSVISDGKKRITIITKSENDWKWRYATEDDYVDLTPRDV